VSPAVPVVEAGEACAPATISFFEGLVSFHDHADLGELASHAKRIRAIFGWEDEKMRYGEAKALKNSDGGGKPF
jgi:hypothetical protein